MKRITALFIAILSGLALLAQASDLPVKEWTSPASTPFILYISGDGGFNSFSAGLCTIINKQGFAITAINAKSYFWNKKTPEKATNDISDYLDKQFQNRKNQQLVLVGYSFGADVMPFIVNRLPAVLKNKLLSVLLLSPSTSTDFEIHWLDMLGNSKKRSMDVVAEINKLGLVKTVTIFGDDETGFTVQNIKLKNYTNENLPGSHHFDGNTDEVARMLIKYCK